MNFASLLQPPFPRLARIRIPLIFSLFWLATAGAVLAILWRVENVPGTRLAVPGSWPATSGISRTPGMPELVMFAHPKCPCTRAGMGELARIMAQCQGRVGVQVMFYKPDGVLADWARTDLWRSAEAIPGVAVREDEDGAEAAIFGATTSGFVVLYDGAGRLDFSGGITAERGHAGDNDGEDAIIAILNGKKAARETTPVLGCSLAQLTGPARMAKGAVCQK